MPTAAGLGAYNFDVKPGEGMGAANGGPRRLPDYMWNFTTNKGLAGHAKPFRCVVMKKTPLIRTAL